MESRTTQIFTIAAVVAIYDCRQTDQDTCILSNQEAGTLPQPEE
ncbi:hypothetical protein [Methanogenium marinum]|nr:hypothetical protein [Methanogenium marinum]